MSDHRSTTRVLDYSFSIKLKSHNEHLCLLPDSAATKDSCVTVSVHKAILHQADALGASQSSCAAPTPLDSTVTFIRNIHTNMKTSV